MDLHPLWRNVEPGFGPGNRPTRLDRGSAYELLAGACGDGLAWDLNWGTWCVFGEPVVVGGLAVELALRGYEVSPAVATEVWNYLTKQREVALYKLGRARHAAEQALRDTRPVRQLPGAR